MITNASKGKSLTNTCLLSLPLRWLSFQFEHMQPNALQLRNSDRHICIQLLQMNVYVHACVHDAYMECDAYKSFYSCVLATAAQ